MIHPANGSQAVNETICVCPDISCSRSRPQDSADIILSKEMLFPTPTTLQLRYRTLYNFLSNTVKSSPKLMLKFMN